MRQAILEHPYRSALARFFGVLLAVWLSGVILGLYVVSAPCDPVDEPCDGAAMAAGFIWYLALFGGIVAATLIGAVSLSFLLVFRKDKVT